MKKLFLLSAVLFLLISPILAQSKLGDVACVYVTSSNLDSSLAFYEKLGFSKTGSNDFPVPWLQVSDGSLIIMMRKDANPYMGLTYYTADLDKVISQLEKDSIIFFKQPSPTDQIKRYYIKSPDGFDIMIANNLGGFEKVTGKTLLNMNPADFHSPEKFPNKQCGAFGEFAHPVMDINKSLAFWKKLGFTAKSEMKTPYPYTILSDGLMIIGLHQTKTFTYPAITYFGINTDKRIQELRDKGLINLQEMGGKKNVILNTWEGQHFFLFTLGM